MPASKTQQRPPSQPHHTPHPGGDDRFLNIPIATALPRHIHPSSRALQATKPGVRSTGENIRIPMLRSVVSLKAEIPL